MLKSLKNQEMIEAEIARPFKPKKFSRKKKPKNHLIWTLKTHKIQAPNSHKLSRKKKRNPRINWSEPTKYKHQTPTKSQNPGIKKTHMSRTGNKKTPRWRWHRPENHNKKEKERGIKDPNQGKRTFSLKERGGRMTVPFFWRTFPILLPAVAANVRQIDSHMLRLCPFSSKKKVRDFSNLRFLGFGFLPALDLIRLGCVFGWNIKETENPRPGNGLDERRSRGF